MSGYTVISLEDAPDADVILVIASIKAADYDGEVEMVDGFWPE